MDPDNEISTNFKVKEIQRTVAVQRRDVRKKSFSSRVQDPWNQIDDKVKSSKNPKAFRKAYKNSKNLV